MPLATSITTIKCHMHEHSTSQLITEGLCPNKQGTFEEGRSGGSRGSREGQGEKERGMEGGVREEGGGGDPVYLHIINISTSLYTRRMAWMRERDDNCILFYYEKLLYQEHRILSYKSLCLL